MGWRKPWRSVMGAGLQPFRKAVAQALVARRVRCRKFNCPFSPMG